MIKNRLAGLIAERGLNITKVSHGTGISRNSITSIAQNDSEMIRIDTINTLCKFFGISPGDFFEFDPIDIEFSIYTNNVSYDVKHSEIDPYETDEYFTITGIDMEVIMKINNEPFDNDFSLHCTLEQLMNFPLYSSSKYTHGIEVGLNFDSDDVKDMFVNKFYSKINPSFYEDIYKKLTKSINDELIKWIGNHFYSLPYSEELKEKFFFAINEYVFVRRMHTDVFKKS